MERHSQSPLRNFRNHRRHFNGLTPRSPPSARGSASPRLPAFRVEISRFVLPIVAERAFGAPEISPIFEEKLERAKGYEPSTPTLARSCSTPELHPHPLGTAARNAPDRQGRSYSQKP